MCGTHILTCLMVLQHLCSNTVRPVTLEYFFSPVLKVYSNTTRRQMHSEQTQAKMCERGSVVFTALSAHRGCSPAPCVWAPPPVIEPCLCGLAVHNESLELPVPQSDYPPATAQGSGLATGGWGTMAEREKNP